MLAICWFTVLLKLRIPGKHIRKVKSSGISLNFFAKKKELKTYCLWEYMTPLVKFTEEIRGEKLR
jgi:hypothetical protein